MNLTFGEVTVSPWLVAIIIICIIAFLAITIIWGIRAHRNRISAGIEEMIGKSAEVITPLDPKGTVFVEGEQWTAISEDGLVQPGEEVVISRIDGLKIYVTKKL